MVGLAWVAPVSNTTLPVPVVERLITGVVVPFATFTGAVPLTEVTVPPLDGLVLVTVKLG